MAKKYASSGALQRVLVFSASECREIDRRCVQDFGLPTLVLMENAAVQVSSAVLDVLRERESGSVLIVAGTGNNGGDGLAAARHLVNAGAAVCVVVIGERRELSSDAAVHFQICDRMGIDVLFAPKAEQSAFAHALRLLRPAREPVARSSKKGTTQERAPTVVLDALFGTGLSREVAGAGAEAIATINEMGEAGSEIIAVDIPSGLDADSGAVRGIAVRANLTVTFAGMKAGMLKEAAPDYLGEVVVAEIGVPRAILEKIIGERPNGGRGKVRNHSASKRKGGS